MSLQSRLSIAIDILDKAVKTFDDNDIVASTVLAGAAQQLLRDVCLSKGIVPTLNELSENDGRTAQKLHDLIAETYNRFKHADREQADIEVLATDAQILLGLAVIDLLKLDPVFDERIKRIQSGVKRINQWSHQTVRS